MAVVAVSLAATGAVDYATGYRYAFSPLYLFPVLVASASLGWAAGMAVAGTAALVWTVAQQPPGTSMHTWEQLVWNSAMRFAVLAFIAWLLAALEEETFAAHHDHLTRLFNRRHFLQALEAERGRSARTGEPYAVLSIDLDHFKKLNDTRGHAAGDAALRLVGSLLVESARAMDLSARMGGDEFSVLLPGADAAAAKSIAERLGAAAAGEFERRGWPLGLSIGIAVGQGGAETIDELLRRADLAMYVEKQARRRGTGAGGGG